MLMMMLSLKLMGKTANCVVAGDGDADFDVCDDAADAVDYCAGYDVDDEIELYYDHDCDDDDENDD